MPIAALLVLWIQTASPDPSVAHHANGLPPPTVTAARVDRPPSLDGRLNDAAWALAPPVGGLLQRDPREGAPVSEATEVRVLYDAEALYVGARLIDSRPERIVGRPGRRDAVTHSDEFHLWLDSHHDHRTAFRFTVNAAGARQDVLIGGDGDFSDESWDPVWDAATSIDSLGWTVEMRIPFSQLRFSRAPGQVWGVRFDRWIQRKNELAIFPFVAKTENGLASRFAHLEGLREIAPPNRLELTPYAVGRYSEPEVGDTPLGESPAYVQGAGVDLKYGLRSDLTLDVTVNPDFGQVELDPAQVNLTAFEQFLGEHRPFFIEGTEIFDFGGTPAFFYSRRIGRPPQGEPPAYGNVVDIPSSTTIVSAAKLSGRAAGGWSLGLLDAVTTPEQATVADTTTGARDRPEVEPLTNYFVGRLRHDSHGGNTSVGFIATAVNRRIRAPALAFLPADAYAAGVDLSHRWSHNTYRLAAALGGSYIRGDTLAIQRAQLASSRYYQRPDATHVRYDPRRTSLAGLAADLSLAKVAGNWTWSLGGHTTTPGFEVNDVGFQPRVDRISAAASVDRRWTRPGHWFRQSNVGLTVRSSWNYDGDVVEREVGAFGSGQLRNFWSLAWSASYDAAVMDDRLTRGGPLARTPAGWAASGQWATDDRGWVSLYAFASYTGNEAGGWSLTGQSQLTLRPSATMSVSLGPYYSTGLATAQYLDRVADSTAVATSGARYVFADLRQRSASMTLRVNAAFSPSFSLQVYAQPFVFVADYDGFKEWRAPETFSFHTYGRDNESTIRDTLLTSGEESAPGYVVDPDGSGGAAAPFTLADPDFRTRSLSLKAVLRWEYRRGSTLFLAWTHSRSGHVPFDASFDLGRDLSRALFRDPPTDVWLAKVSYWLSL